MTATDPALRRRYVLSRCPTVEFMDRHDMARERGVRPESVSTLVTRGRRALERGEAWPVTSVPRPDHMSPPLWDPRRADVRAWAAAGRGTWSTVSAAPPKPVARKRRRKADTA